MALFLLLATFTASRPGAIVESDNYRNSNQSLEYGEVKLRSERDSSTKKAQLVLIMYFHKRKYRRTNEETSFRVSDLSLDSIAWPILLLLALAFHEKAFEVPHLIPKALTTLEVSFIPCCCYIHSIIKLALTITVNS